MGNYAAAIVWSDGHSSSIYTFDRLLGDEIPGVWVCFILIIYKIFNKKILIKEYKNKNIK